MDICTTWRRFIPPDDLGLETAPPLPLGHHYAQTSTDRAHGRAKYGWFAINGGQIVLVPWIQNTETVLLYWDGIKRDWTDLDPIDPDPLFKRTIEAYVRWQHEMKHGHDPKIQADAESAYNAGVAQLMYLCRQENELMDSRAMGFDDARGSSQVIKTYVNEAQQATANCQSPQTGTPITVSIPAGTVSSLISVDDANAKARSQALQQAGAQLNCTTPAIVYENTAQHYTADCGLAQGNPVSVTVPAGTFTSSVSQADADAQALASATASANAALSCTFLNAEQTYMASCQDSSHPTTVTVAAGAFTSTISQSDADALAMASAQSQVNATLASLCSATTLYHNTQQVVPVSYYCNFTRTTLTGNITVAANTFTSTASQSAANLLAQQYAQTVGRAQLAARCRPPVGGVNVS